MPINENFILKLQTGTVSPQFHVQHDYFYETRKEERGDIVINVWCRLSGISRIEDKKRTLSIRGSMPREHAKDINEEAHAPNSTEDMMDQESIEKMLTEGDNIQPNRIKSVMEIKLKEQELLSHSTHYDVLREENYETHDMMDYPITFKITNDSDTMCYYEDMREFDRGEFIKAMVKEVEDNVKHDHWELVPRDKVLARTKVIDSAWYMKRKRHIMTRKTYEQKSPLNFRGFQQEFSINYFQTHSPTVN